MIDTDKYEGHPPAPRRLDADIDYNCDLRVGFTASHDGYSIGCLHTDKPTSQLIADAPLLLAEVKRLREQPKVTIDEWDKVLNSEHEGPYVTMYLEDGREYIGALRLYKDENGKVVE